MATWLPYDSHKLRTYNGNASNFASGGDTFKLMLVTSSYTPNRATHTFKSDITNEVSGSNYTAGGATLATLSLTVSANVLHWDVADVTWLQHATGFSTARYAVLYKDTGVAATSPVVCYLDLGGNVGNVAGDLTIQIADVFTV